MPKWEKGKKTTAECKPKLMSVEDFWTLFCAYRQHITSNPIFKTDFCGKDAVEVQRPLHRPLTLDGFENYLYEINKINDIGDYVSNKGGRYADYIEIIDRIRRIIRQHQIEGGMAGIFNPNITARLNGLVEKSSVEVREQPLLDD